MSEKNVAWAKNVKNGCLSYYKMDVDKHFVGHLQSQFESNSLIIAFISLYRWKTMYCFDVS